MKLSLNFSRARFAGFTVVEIYVASATLIILVIAITAVQFFAARVYTLAATKLTATAAGRKIMNDIREQTREGIQVEVGIYTPANNTFTNIPIGSPQIGNALLISPKDDLNTLYGTIYFMNRTASNLCSVNIANSVVQPSTLAPNIIVYVTNYYVFDAEDSYTNIFTNYDNGRVIHITLQFAQWEYPLAGVGNGAMYDYYQLQTRVAQRIPEPSY